MKRLLLPLAMLAAFCGAAHAEGPMKAGLWEMTIKSDAMKNMPKIPPAQLEQMKKMGVEIPQMSDGGMVTRVCISKEMAARDTPPEVNQRQGGCQSKNYKRSGNSYTVDIVCDSPNMKGEGKAQGSFNGKDSFSSTFDFKGVSHGKPVSQHQESNGKWLGADCGNVAPADKMMGAHN